MRYIIGFACLAMLASCNSAPEAPVSALPTQAIATATPTPATAASAEEDAGKLWVVPQFVERRTCPSERCGSVGRAFFRQAMTPLETRAGWVRVTRIYDAACENGKSAYVDRGNAACTASNGIEEGKFGEWVRVDQLAKTRPADPADKATADEQLVKGSDDFGIYHAAFATLAQQLIASGRCTRGDFEEQGGFTKSANRPDEPVYFTYCGGMTADAKIYVNAKTVTVE